MRMYVIRSKNFIFSGKTFLFSGLTALLLSCSHRSEGKLLQPAREYQNNLGQTVQEYVRYIDEDCIKDRTIETYNKNGELIHYELDLGNDGSIEKVWNQGAENQSEENLPSYQRQQCLDKE